MTAVAVLQVHLKFIQKSLLKHVEQRYRKVMHLQSVRYRDFSEDLKLQSLLRNVTILVQAAFRLQSESLLPDSEFHLIRFLKSMKVLMEQSLPFLNHRKEWLL